MDKKTFKKIMKLKDVDFIMYLRSKDPCELFVWMGTQGKDPYINSILDRATKIVKGYQEALKWALGRGTK